MSTIEIQSLFAEHGIKDTGNRLLIARALHESGQPLSLLELEAILGTIDKSTILRTLNLFRESHLVHVIESGDGCTRYEICQSHHHDDDEDEDAHLHFFCESCHQTICLSDKHIPQIELPCKRPLPEVREEGAMNRIIGELSVETRRATSLLGGSVEQV